MRCKLQVVLLGCIHYFCYHNHHRGTACVGGFYLSTCCSAGLNVNSLHHSPMCTPQAHQQACLWPQQQHLWTAWRPMRSHPHTCAAKRAAGCHFSSSPLTSHIGHHQHAAASSCIAGRASNRDDTALDSLEELEIAVPADQRPVNELAALKQSFLYDWVRVECSAVQLLVNA